MSRPEPKVDRQLEMAVLLDALDNQERALVAVGSQQTLRALRRVRMTATTAVETFEEAREVLRGFLLYFTSGNAVPVERATISASSEVVTQARAVLARMDGGES